METTRQSQGPMHALEDEYNPFVAPQLDNPSPVWEQAREECPVFFSTVIGGWVVTRYDDVISILRNTEAFGPGIERKMFAASCPEADQILDALPPLDQMNAVGSEPPTHTKLRRYLQPAFMPHKAAALEPEFRQLANALIDEFESRGHGDFYQDFAYRYPLAVVGRLIGLPEEPLGQIREWANQHQELRYGNLPPDEQIVAARGQRDAFEFALDLVTQRRANPSDDLLSWIIQDSDSSEDPLSDAQLASQATTMLTAGHETTAHFLTMLLRRVLQQDRSLWTALAEDPAVRAAELEESLRMDGPVQAIWRKAKIDTEVAGVTIPAGARVSVVLGSANVDGEVFPSPEVFDPTRPNVAQHVAFGRGIHTCVGAGVARMEGNLALELLARRLPKLRLADDDGFLFKPSATQRMARRLLVEWD